MSNDPRLDVLVRLNTTQFDRDIRGLLSDLRALEGRSFDVQVGLNTVGDVGEITRQLAGLNDETVDVRLNLTGDNVTDIERFTQDQTVNIDTDVNDSQVDGLFRRLSESVTLTIDIPDVVGMAGGAIGGAAGFAFEISGVSGLFETNQALLELEAATGRIIPNAERLINDIYTDGWGESRTEIAETIATAAQLQIANENLEEATTSALQVALVTGEDANEVLLD